MKKPRPTIGGATSAADYRQLQRARPRALLNEGRKGNAARANTHPVHAAAHSMSLFARPNAFDAHSITESRWSLASQRLRYDRSYEAIPQAMVLRSSAMKASLSHAP
jgi:hypothetical protein